MSFPLGIESIRLVGNLSLFANKNDSEQVGMTVIGEEIIRRAIKKAVESTAFFESFTHHAVRMTQYELKQKRNAVS